MKCPACGADNPDDKEFCGDCGVHLTPEQTAAEAAGVPEPPYVETTAIPHEQYAAATAPPPVETNQGAYQPQPQPTQPVYQQPAYAPPPSAPPAAPPKKKTGLIIAIVAGVVLLCLLGCCITLFLIPTDDTTDDTNVTQDDDQIVISAEEGFASSMDALSDVADQYYRGDDWWYLEIAIEDDYEEYYITPDETTYDKGVILEKRNGEWFVTDVYTVDMSQVAVEEGTGTTDTDTTGMTDEEAAATAVDTLLLAIMEGRMEDAYAVTTSPLYDYDLSVLTGEYTGWEFLGAEMQEDSSVVVVFTMYWSDGTTENVGALVVPGDLAWYVSDMGSADE
jgi:hypothetical protein